MPPKRQSIRPPPMRRAATPLPGMNMTRSVLPAEIISTILDYLPVRDLLAFARVSHRLQEMVYDDTRWVTKLQLMGVWNEIEARKRFEEAIKRRRASGTAKRAEEKRFAEARASGNPGTGTIASTLFDAVDEKKKTEAMVKKRITIAGGEGLMTALPPSLAPMRDKESLLSVICSIRSIRGFARQEFGRVYGALAPLYFDLVRARTHTDPIVFREYRNPEDQARMLAQLRTFSECDTAMGWAERLERLNSMMGVFENAALREFEGGYEACDFDDRMSRYAHVLFLLNGGQACIQLFVHKHPLLYEREELGNPMDCFDNPEVGSFSLEPMTTFWEKLVVIMNHQINVIDRVFPPALNVLMPFLERISEDVITDFITPILDEAHEREIEQYLQAVTGILRQSLEFGASLQPGKNAPDSFRQDVLGVLAKIFDAHVDLYLQEELDYNKQKFEAEVDTWEKKIQEQDAATESFFMSNINREADKRDFLSSFKKVILAPVSVIPSAFSFTKPYIPDTLKFTMEGSSYTPNSLSDKLSTMNIEDTSYKGAGGSISPVQSIAPRSELAAKAAVMNSRLEGIRNLFSLEVALSLVHKAKEGLERAAVFARIGGRTGEEAREQCEAIFVALLQVLGPCHVKAGFDKAVEHLRQYNPREVAHTESGVAPLVKFLDLVNVGDLIQQMIDVFYEQELVAAKLTDRNDFLNPASKEKKRFEQMLDERVAAGLNVGIDVLIDEVEHILATTQQAADFNPGVLIAGDSGPSSPVSYKQHQQADIGPTFTARRIVEIVETHTNLLVGSIDKNVLDVFNQEVGVRLFAAVCKHIKRQRISVDGAITLISDVNHYYNYIATLKLKPLIPYFTALRELAQIYLIAPGHAKQMATVIADPSRFAGIFRVEEVYEYAARREDWYSVKKEVEKAMYGYGCAIM